MFRQPVRAALAVLSDPAGRLPATATGSLNDARLAALLKQADRHGVLAAVVANLRDCLPPDRLSRPAVATALAWADRQLVARTGLSLALRRQLDRIAAAFVAAGLPACVIKGPDFSDRLYPAPSLRPFTDIDLLIDADSRQPAERIMAGLGYAPERQAMKHKTGYAEQSWRRPEGVGGAVEVHWNLVNSPTIRRRVSIGLADLRMDRTAAGWRLPRPDGSSVLLIGAVHAAASHCFDRLQMLWDVCQAVRGQAGPLDEPWLADTVKRTGSGLAMTAALHLGAAVLGERACGRLIERLGLPSPGLLLRAMLTRGVVLRGRAGRDSIRRQIFREALKRS